MSELREERVLAKIEWKNTEYYVRQKRITIGRHSSKGYVDIDLGDSSFISRVHLEIIFEESDFLLKCKSKNGIFVDDHFQRPSDGLQVLPSRCIIGFPSTGMYMVFTSLVEETAVPEPLPPASAAGPALSSADTGSAWDSRPVSPDTTKEDATDVIIDVTDENVSYNGNVSYHGNGGPASLPPLLHHSYSTYGGGGGGGGVRSSPAPAVPTSSDDSRPASERSKPPFSYAQLIVQALTSSKDRQLTLSGIYSYITRHYPYYRTADKGWQNSIRHNLSLNRSFVKVSRGQSGGKGSFWRVEPQAEPGLVEQAFSRKRKGGATAQRGSRVVEAADSSPSRWPRSGAGSPMDGQSRSWSPAAVVDQRQGQMDTGEASADRSVASLGHDSDDIIIVPSDAVFDVADEYLVAPEASTSGRPALVAAGGGSAALRGTAVGRC